MGRTLYANDYVRFRTAIQAACNVYGVTRRHILGRRRFRHYTDARHMAMLLTRQSTELSLKSMGIFFQRDHSTIVHALKSIQDVIDTSEDYKRRFNQIVNEYDMLIEASSQ